MLPHDSKGSFSKSSNIVSLSHTVILPGFKNSYGTATLLRTAQTWVISSLSTKQTDTVFCHLIAFNFEMTISL